MAELPKDPIPPETRLMIYFACKRDISFKAQAMSSASRCAIAAASGIMSITRFTSLALSAEALGVRSFVT